ncbi:MAG: hypothetical protein ACLU7D_07045 [Collinsella sp.]
MNSQLIQQGRAAYRAGDFSAAAQMLGAAKTPDEIMGEADHLRGNALMHLGMYCRGRRGAARRRPQRRRLRQARRPAHQPRQAALAAVGDWLTTAAQAFSVAARDAFMPRL